MSFDRAPFAKNMATHRTYMAPVDEDDETQDKQNLRADALTFKPKVGRSATIGANSFEEPAAIVNRAQRGNSTTTRGIQSVTSTPPSNATSRRSSGASTTDKQNRSSVGSGAAFVGDLFHNQGSTWASHLSALHRASNPENNGNILLRASDHSGGSNGTDGARFVETASDASTPVNRKKGNMSSTPSTHVISPTPRRQLFPMHNSNDNAQGIEKIAITDGGPSGHNGIGVSSGGSVKNGHSLGNPKGLTIKTGPAMLWQVPDLPSPMSGCDTPGGVMLPKGLMSPEPGAITPHFLPGEVNPTSVQTKRNEQAMQPLGQNGNAFVGQHNPTYAGPSNGRIHASHLNGSTNDSQQLSTNNHPGHAVQSHAGTHDSVVQGNAPHQENAKVLADFIRGGGLEQPVPTRASGVGQNYRTGMPQRGFSNGHPPGVNGVPPPVANAAPQYDALVERWKVQERPNWSEISQNVAFTERPRTVAPVNYGVIKIADIPYQAVKAEIVALIGEKAPMVKMPKGSGTYATHIIMERSTAKSMDAYVEFETPQAAEAAVARIQAMGRRSMGARRITVTLSSQEALMKELFPRAKCVRWDGCHPVVVEQDENFASSTFKGFITGEEMVMTAKVAQNPNRSRFAAKHQQRTFESMVSLMFKYPWHCVNLYTLRERDIIFKTTYDQIGILVQRLHRDGPRGVIDFALLDQLLSAGLQCPGFSENQRAKLIDASEGLVAPKVYITPMAPSWPFEVLSRKEDVTETRISYFASLLKKATMPNVGTSLAQIAAAQAMNSYAVVGPFGDIRIPWPANKHDVTMANAALIEWGVVEGLLRKVTTER